jgi:GNAT superfamily N-acetyltransferase
VPQSARSSIDSAGEASTTIPGCEHDCSCAIVWESTYAGFRSCGVPLVHQIAVARPFRRQGVATLLMDSAEQLARDQGVATLGITVGLFDEYGPAQRLYGCRGYIPKATPALLRAARGSNRCNGPA